MEQAMIRFEGVHKWFGELHVLNNINLTVKQGEVVVVCGRQVSWSHMSLMFSGLGS